MSLQPTFGTFYGFSQQHHQNLLDPHRRLHPLDTLNMLVNEHIADEEILRNISRSIRPRRGVLKAIYMSHPRTSDHYVWFGEIEVQFVKGKAAILFPYSNDYEYENDVRLDRSVGVFSQDLHKRTVDALVRNVYMLYSSLAQQRPKESQSIMIAAG
jgi:hypothetical protein